MKYIKNVRMDIQHGMLKNKRLLLLPLLLTVIIFLDFANRVSLYCNAGAVVKKDISAADFWMYLYGGMKEYIPGIEGFRFPSVWLVLFVGIAFPVLNYPFDHMKGVGVQILSRSGSRRSWWLAKCTWNFFCTFLFHALVFVTGLLLCFLWDLPVNNRIDGKLIQLLFEMEAPLEGTVCPWYVFLLPFIVSASVNLLQMTVSLFVRPVFGFCVTLTLLIVSAYDLHPALVGNYAMGIRLQCFLAAGVEPAKGILLSVLLSAACVIVGVVKFNSYDILNGENEV